MTVPVLQPLRGFALAGIVLASSAAACGERAQSKQPDALDAGAAAAEPMDDAAPARPPMDPCALLTEQEISEQLLLTLSPTEVANLTPKEFEVTPTEVPWGESRRCEFAYASKDRSSGTPMLRGNFNVMVSPIAFVGAIQERDRRPVAGAGPEIFKYQKMGERAYYVVKGKYGASLTDFRGHLRPERHLIGRRTRGAAPSHGRAVALTYPWRTTMHTLIRAAALAWPCAGRDNERRTRRPGQRGPRQGRPDPPAPSSPRRRSKRRPAWTTRRGTRSSRSTCASRAGRPACGAAPAAG